MALKNKRTEILSFVLPGIVVYALFVLFPLVETVRMSFYSWDGLTPPSFAGIKNFVKLFGDSLFYRSTKNGLIFAGVIAVFQIGVGLLLAVMITAPHVRFRKFFRSSYFIPVVLSTVMVGQMWLAILNGKVGALNRILDALGIGYRQDWLGSPSTAILVVAMVNGWQFMGYHFLLYLTAIKAIPSEIIDSSMIEGAGFFQRLGRIQLPLLQETFKISLIIALTGGLKAFAEIYVMTGGGPGTATYTLPMMMIRAMTKFTNYGYGVTIATVLLAQCVLASVIVNTLVARERITY